MLFPKRRQMCNYLSIGEFYRIRIWLPTFAAKFKI